MLLEEKRDGMEDNRMEEKGIEWMHTQLLLMKHGLLPFKEWMELVLKRASTQEDTDVQAHKDTKQ